MELGVHNEYLDVHDLHLYEDNEPEEADFDNVATLSDVRDAMCKGIISVAGRASKTDKELISAVQAPIRRSFSHLDNILGEETGLVDLFSSIFGKLILATNRFEKTCNKEVALDAEAILSEINEIIQLFAEHGIKMNAGLLWKLLVYHGAEKWKAFFESEFYTDWLRPNKSYISIIAYDCPLACFDIFKSAKEAYDKIMGDKTGKYAWCQDNPGAVRAECLNSRRSVVDALDKAGDIYRQIEAGTLCPHMKGKLGWAKDRLISNPTGALDSFKAAELLQEAILGRADSTWLQDIPDLVFEVCLRTKNADKYLHRCKSIFDKARKDPRFTWIKDGFMKRAVLKRGKDAIKHFENLSATGVSKDAVKAAVAELRRVRPEISLIALAKEIADILNEEVEWNVSTLTRCLGGHTSYGPAQRKEVCDLVLELAKQRQIACCTDMSLCESPEGRESIVATLTGLDFGNIKPTDEFWGIDNIGGWTNPEGGHFGHLFYKSFTERFGNNAGNVFSTNLLPLFPYSFRRNFATNLPLEEMCQRGDFGQLAKIVKVTRGDCDFATKKWGLKHVAQRTLSVSESDSYNTGRSLYEDLLSHCGSYSDAAFFFRDKILPHLPRAWQQNYRMELDWKDRGASIGIIRSRVASQLGIPTSFAELPPEEVAELRRHLVLTKARDLRKWQVASPIANGRLSFVEAMVDAFPEFELQEWHFQPLGRAVFGAVQKDPSTAITPEDLQVIKDVIAGDMSSFNELLVGPLNSTPIWIHEGVQRRDQVQDAATHMLETLLTMGTDCPINLTVLWKMTNAYCRKVYKYKDHVPEEYKPNMQDISDFAEVSSPDKNLRVAEILASVDASDRGALEKFLAGEADMSDPAILSAIAGARSALGIAQCK